MYKEEVASNHYNRGTKYLNARNYDKALSFFKKQLKTHSFKELHLNMGNAYRMLNMPSMAEKQYILAASPEIPFATGEYGPYALGLNNLGLHYFSCGEEELAQELYLKAIDLDPSYGEARWNMSISLLRASNCKSRVGWDMYEYRFDRGAGSVQIAKTPRWDFAMTGSEIYVLTEQGFGDKIQFARYLPYLAGFFKSVKVVCHESLELFYSGYECVRSVPADALSVPLCSLPRAFGIVPQSAEFLSDVVPHQFSNMTDTLAGRAKRLNIGVVWTGSKTHSNDHNRSCPNHEILKLVGMGNLYSLNPADPRLKGIVPLAPRSWEETAAYVKGLDVIVSVDTSIVHLAASLGKPVIMMQPLRETDFRWGNTGRGHVQPWYPSLHILHNPNNWGVVIENVKEMLSHANNFKT